MSSDNTASQMYNPNVKATEPDKMGSQYADSPPQPFNGQKNCLSVTRDQFGNEIAEDRTNHDNTTASEGSWNFTGGQYSDDWKGGFDGGYGTPVARDNGTSPQVERTSVDNSRADRGKEA